MSRIILIITIISERSSLETEEVKNVILSLKGEKKEGSKKALNLFPSVTKKKGEEMNTTVKQH